MSDPGTAARLDHFREQGGVVPAGVEGRRLLAALMDSGGFLPGLLAADVGLLPALLADPWLHQPKPAPVIFAEAQAETAAAADFEDFSRRLRAVRRREMLRLGARELGFGTTEEVAEELSGFADACLELAFRFCDGQLRREHGEPLGDEEPAAFVVLALGKLGGQELNFSSDVDLCYFYSTDAGQAGAISLHEYYVKLSRRITTAIEEVTADGTIFRVDLRLRPEGRAGPICNSFAAAERYYETFGRTWERQALLRARPCAGDKVLGQRLLGMLEPFIYPRHIDPAMVEEIRALRALFRGPADQGGAGQGFDVKLGAGGIRDVELVVQALQLLHGGKRRDLRDRSTPRGLQRLLVAGLISDREARALGEAYRFWRRLEHRVQLEEGAQTHRLPGDAAARARLAERLGWGAGGLPALDAAIARHRAAVELVAATFDDPAPALRPEVQVALDPTRSRAEVEAALGGLGFRDVELGAAGLELVRARLPPAFLQQAAASPDPDRALGHFRELTLGGSAGLMALLRGQPQLLRMLATLFGTSDRLSQILIRHPAMWESFTENLGAPTRSAGELRAAAAARVAALHGDGGGEPRGDGDGDGEAEEAGLRELRRFQAEEHLRIGLHDVAGSLHPGQVAEQLAAVAEACIAEAIALGLPRLQARYGVPATGLTVLGLGSLGAREMRYGSDVDLIFLYGRDGESSKGIDHREWYGRASQRFIGSMEAMLEEGRLYHVDTRLRPSGEQGMLVTSHAAFERYHQQEAAGWERVALLRARIVYSAEEPAARAALASTLEAIAYDRPLDEERFRQDLRRVRQRVEDERGQVPAGARHLRFDPGGIMDVEFMVALGQLRLGADPGLRTTSTMAALRRLVALGWPATLIEDYAFLRRLALRLRLLRDRPEDVLGPDDLAPLARTFDEREVALGAELDQRMSRVRSIYAATF